MGRRAGQWPLNFRKAVEMSCGADYRRNTVISFEGISRGLLTHTTPTSQEGLLQWSKIYKRVLKSGDRITRCSEKKWVGTGCLSAEHKPCLYRLRGRHDSSMLCEHDDMYRASPWPHMRHTATFLWRGSISQRCGVALRKHCIACALQALRAVKPLYGWQCLGKLSKSIDRAAPSCVCTGLQRRPFLSCSVGTGKIIWYFLLQEGD